MRPARRATMILRGQPISDLPERLESERYPKGSTIGDDASGSRYAEEPYNVDPKLPGDKARQSYLTDGAGAISARRRRVAFDQPRLDGGTGDEIVHTLTENGDQEARDGDRLARPEQIHAWRCAQCHTAVRTAQCQCPVRCPACGGTHIRADVTREPGKTREGGPTEASYQNWLAEEHDQSPSPTLGTAT